MNVCDSCARLGRRIDVPPTKMREKKPLELSVSSISPDFAGKVKAARSAAGLSLEELGKKIKEKASVLERVERGMRPTDGLARKLEKALKIKLLGFQAE